jgi:hypothetical protein
MVIGLDFRQMERDALLDEFVETWTVVTEDSYSRVKRVTELRERLESAGYDPRFLGSISVRALDIVTHNSLSTPEEQP